MKSSLETLHPSVRQLYLTLQNMSKDGRIVHECANLMQQLKHYEAFPDPIKKLEIVRNANDFIITYFREKYPV